MACSDPRRRDPDRRAALHELPLLRGDGGPHARIRSSRAARTDSTCPPAPSGRRPSRRRPGSSSSATRTTRPARSTRRRRSASSRSSAATTASSSSADEVYREFLYDGRASESALSLAGFEDEVVVVDSLSKRFSRLRNPARRPRHAQRGAGRRGEPHGAGAALPARSRPGHRARRRRRSARTTTAGVVTEYQKRRDTLFEGLSGIPGVFLRKPEGAFYLVARLPVEDGDDFAAWLLTDFQLGREDRHGRARERLLRDAGPREERGPDRLRPEGRRPEDGGRHPRGGAFRRTERQEASTE